MFATAYTPGMARRDPSVFERTAAGYSRVRPGYPDALFEFVLDATGLQPSARLLELGCGPGLATEGFAARGFHVHAVDAAAAMIEQARARVAGRGHVTFEQALFEEWDGPPTPVDLVYAGMAWHWLDPDVRDANVAQWLSPAGWVAVMTNWTVTPWEEGQDLYAAHWPNRTPPVRRTIEERIAQTRTDFDEAGFFGVVAVGRWPRSIRYSADVYLQVLDTYSDHVVLPEAIKRPFYEAVHKRIQALGGSIERPLESVVVLARPTRQSRRSTV